MTEKNTLNSLPLGRRVSNPTTYSPELLFAFPRDIQRMEIAIKDHLPFSGIDIWNAYELSWLNEKGKPEIAIAEIYVPCESPFIFESKSCKLYLNSFNQSKFTSFDDVKNIMEKDLSECAKTKVIVKLFSHQDLKGQIIEDFPGICLDNLDISCDTYITNPKFLSTENTIASETLYTHLLKANCLVTGQPDFGSVAVRYEGKKIDHENLLKYFISFRSHIEFGEHCVERIFMDILNHCSPEKLTVYGRFTRRGGLDINPFRSNFEKPWGNIRLARQ